MLHTIKLESLIMIDIETVPGCGTYEELDERMKPLWDQKTSRQRLEEHSDQEHYFSNAGILAEFGKVVCISIGIFAHDKASGRLQLRLKSYYGDNEREVLVQFANMLNAYYDDITRHKLCGHNIREFDVPFLCRRMLVHGIQLPKLLDLFGLKPWEIPHLDTMQLWKFGDYKNYTSLNLLANLFDIPTPKDDIDGSDVGRVYYEEKDLERIKNYCQKDVVTVARLLQRLKGEAFLLDDQLVYA